MQTIASFSVVSKYNLVYSIHVFRRFNVASIGGRSEAHSEVLLMLFHSKQYTLLTLSL